ncbi:hypothetical protein [Burkholderia oklahomensis]|uniref:hypothetical protein n=1 Tax=Burkholderia oklahomensis TaxID=342113 RepID=UPI0005D89CF6|nr:hypothetical protein [Burkholderia oklahomensis]AJX33936.1 hypothetical protein BG90_4777 [Burkholderia oklahomensis C6786]SUY27449.1 Uncharacterised protein [Burkholderia oklahomensis]
MARKAIRQYISSVEPDSGPSTKHLIGTTAWLESDYPALIDGNGIDQSNDTPLIGPFIAQSILENRRDEYTRFRT